METDPSASFAWAGRRLRVAALGALAASFALGAVTHAFTLGLAFDSLALDKSLHAFHSGPGEFKGASGAARFPSPAFEARADFEMARLGLLLLAGFGLLVSGLVLHRETEGRRTLASIGLFALAVVAVSPVPRLLGFPHLLRLEHLVLAVAVAASLLVLVSATPIHESFVALAAGALASLFAAGLAFLGSSSATTPGFYAVQIGQSSFLILASALYAGALAGAVAGTWRRLVPAGANPS